jgi:serine/threonine protein kinase
MSKRVKEANPLMPERIGRYDVLLPIASGGMGTVYLARSKGVGGFERDVAIKVMHQHLREEESFADDLIEEAKLAVRIQHPNVVPVLDVGEDPHGVFLVMDYVEGDSLAGITRTLRKLDRNLPERIGLRVLHDALLGLHAAHELRDKGGELLGLVHRDFSPQNILVGADGVTKLTDFGVAKARTRTSHTATGLVKGKIHYMSPEQARTEEIDRRCDVWAAGVIAWEMLARKRLYRERNDTSVLLQLISEPPVRLRTVRPEVPQPLEDAVAHALATDVEHRCPTAKELADELERGAQAIGGLADRSEVADLVRQLSGTHLETRREQVSEVMKLRASLASIADMATVDTGAVTTPSHLGAMLESRARKYSDDEAPTLNSEEENSVTKTAGSLSVRVPINDSERRRRLMMLLGAALGATLLVGWFALRDTVPPNAPIVPAPAGTAAETIATTGSTSEPSAKPSSEPSATPSVVTVEVTANRAIATIKLGKRVVEPNSAGFELSLTADEQKGPLKLHATSIDGRQTIATWRPGRAKIALTFAPRTIRRPPPSKKPPPLAPNPFDP